MIRVTTPAAFIICYCEENNMRLTKNLVLGMALLIILLSSFYSIAWAQSDAEEPDVVITFFWRVGCSHCAAEKPFLQELADKYPQIDLKGYEVYYNSANREYLFALGEAMDFETSGVPVTVIGDQVWIGYGDDKAAEIESVIETCLVSGCPDAGEAAGIDTGGLVTSLGEEETANEEEASLSFPVWIVAAVVIVVGSYFLGAYLRTHKKKTNRKRH